MTQTERTPIPMNKCRFSVTATSSWHADGFKIYSVKVTCHPYKKFTWYEFLGEFEEYNDEGPYTKEYIEECKKKAYEDMVTKAKRELEALEEFFSEGAGKDFWDTAREASKSMVKVLEGKVPEHTG